MLLCVRVRAHVCVYVVCVIQFVEVGAAAEAVAAVAAAAYRIATYQASLICEQHELKA